MTHWLELWWLICWRFGYSLVKDVIAHWLAGHFGGVMVAHLLEMKVTHWLVEMWWLIDRRCIGSLVGNLVVHWWKIAVARWLGRCGDSLIRNVVLLVLDSGDSFLEDVDALWMEMTVAHWLEFCLRCGTDRNCVGLLVGHV